MMISSLFKVFSLQMRRSCHVENLVFFFGYLPIPFYFMGDYTFVLPNCEYNQSRIPAKKAPSVRFECRWLVNGVHCSLEFDLAEELYSHLENQHVGRANSVHGLCLSCRWENCNYEAKSKRRSHMVNGITIYMFVDINRYHI